MTMVYLASPYTSFKDKNSFMEEFMYVSGAYMVKNPGHFCVSPLFNHFSLESNPGLGTDWEFWKKYSYTLLDRLSPVNGDYLLVANFACTKDSVGVMAEVFAAAIRNIPTFILDVDTLEIEQFDMSKLN